MCLCMHSHVWAEARCQAGMMHMYVCMLGLVLLCMCLCMHSHVWAEARGEDTTAYTHAHACVCMHISRCQAGFRRTDTTAAGDGAVARDAQGGVSPCTLHPAPCTRHPAPGTLYPAALCKGRSRLKEESSVGESVGAPVGAPVGALASGSVGAVSEILRPHLVAA